MFIAGKLGVDADLVQLADASMRPAMFIAGKRLEDGAVVATQSVASMRPAMFIAGKWQKKQWQAAQKMLQ